MIFIGIDIGLTGAVCAVDTRGTGCVRDMPITADGKPRKTKRVVKGVEKTGTKQPMRIDGRALQLLLLEMVPPGAAGCIVFEDVRARSIGNGGKATNGMHSQGSLMQSKGAVQAVSDIVRHRVEAVQPQTWKRHFGLILEREAGETDGEFERRKKLASMDKARALFPCLAYELARVKDHNRAEALLIARYGQEAFA